jgi:hypothetical protein
MFDGLDVSRVTALRPIPMDWGFVNRLRDTVTVKLLSMGTHLKHPEHSIVAARCGHWREPG